MTWGQIRLELRQELPTVDLHLLNGWIRTAYERILESRPWAGLKHEGRLVTAAPVVAGDVAVTSGSATVTGTATVWTESMIGRVFRTQPDGDWYQIAGVDELAQTLTLAEDFTGATATAAPYAIAQFRYTLPAEVKTVNIVQLPHAPEAWTSYAPNDLKRWSISTPVVWRPGPRTPEGSGGSRNTLELYPVPDAAMAIPYSFLAAVQGFTGNNTEDEPLPWVDVETLKASVRMRAGVAGAVEDRNEGLILMAAADNRRTPPAPITGSRWDDPAYSRYRRR